ncbi:hypothetical protein FGRMN_1335 [Fusarium graminum]|nr:hypothetical protein FGRMN_1335 [Fusarium graminum]
MSDPESTDNPRKTLKEGSPEDKIRAWLQITRDESGTSKQGDWMNTLIPHLEFVSSNVEGPHPSCVFSYTVQPDNCNRLQNLHGGCAATLFDWCTTLPIALVNKPGFWQHLGVSRTLSVTYMRPVPKSELEFVHDTVTRLLKNASPSLSDEAAGANFSKTHASSRNAALLQRLFSQAETLEAFLEGSSLFNRLRNDLRQVNRESPLAPTSANDACRALQQKSAHLHCLYGKPILNVGRLRSTRTYPYACSKVYDLRNYTDESGWGPFMNDGSFNVDWEKVEAILIVLGHNIGAKRVVARIFGDIWDSPFSGSFQNSFMAPPPRDISSLEARDPYGVTGTCDFFAFNFGFNDNELVAPDATRPPLDVGEATRLIMMRIHVTSLEPPGPEDGQELPVVHFRGVSRSLDDSFDDNANSDIRGTARLTKEGEVRWTTFSIFHGIERWRSEGIQIGGVRSARGVVGNWFDRDYDVHGPAGPTAFWKGATPEQVENMEDDLLPSDFFLPYGVLIDIDSETDPEGEMPYSGEDEEEDDEDEEMEGMATGEELSALIHDANLPLEESLVNGHVLN